MNALPPSRDSNPFATCWTRPDAVCYEPIGAPSIDTVVERLRYAPRGVAIVGPHGAGKSTLLRALAGPLAQAAWRTLWIDATTTHAAALSNGRDDGGRCVALIEGFERLAPARRAAWLTRCRQAGMRPVVTLHRRRAAWRHRLVVAATVAPDRLLVTRLFRRLTHGRSTPVTLDDALASHARHGADVRSIWFDLYHLHEQRVRRSRTTGPHAA